MKSYERCKDLRIEKLNGVPRMVQCKRKRVYGIYCRAHAKKHGLVLAISGNRKKGK